MRVLLTGATGYIGGRLLRSLEEDGRLVRCLARQPETIAAGKGTTEVVQEDCLDESPSRVFSIEPLPLRVAMARALEEDAAAERKLDTRVVDVAAPPRRRLLHALAPFLLLALLPIQAQERSPVRTVGRVDLSRYVGDWFEIARYPNRFQRRCIGDVRASYATRPDGRLDVVNRCRTDEGPIAARGVARIVDAGTSAKLKVRFAPAFLSFLPFVWGDYWILGLADDYSWAVVGSPDRNYLWLLARVPELDPASYAAALDAARANGFDVDRLVKTTHAANPDRAR